MHLFLALCCFPASTFLQWSLCVHLFPLSILLPSLIAYLFPESFYLSPLVPLFVLLLCRSPPFWPTVCVRWLPPAVRFHLSSSRPPRPPTGCLSLFHERWILTPTAFPASRSTICRALLQLRWQSADKRPLLQPAARTAGRGGLCQDVGPAAASHEGLQTRHMVELAQRRSCFSFFLL